MIVVADSSPINYLLLIGQVHLLTDLFGEVVIPKAVFAELQSKEAPRVVRDWVREAPDWLRVEGVPVVRRSCRHVAKGSEAPPDESRRRSRA